MTAVFWEAIFIFALILANGLFSLAEIALVSVRRARLQARADDGDPAAKTALALADNPNRFLATVQIGITLVGVLSGALGGGDLSVLLTAALAQVSWLKPVSEPLAVGVVVLIITYLSLVLGELIPKRLGLTDPEHYALLMARAMSFISKITAPVVRLLGASTDLGLRMMGVNPTTESPVTEEEVKVMIEQGTQEGVFGEREQDFVESVFRLSDRYVEALMTSRTEIAWLDVDAPIEETLREVMDGYFGCYPVAQGELDNVLGIVESRALLAQALSGQPVDLRALLRPPLFIPESTPALRAVEQLKRSGERMGLVLDEYGGLVGIITPYDVFTTIASAVPTPSATDEPRAVRRSDGSWLVDGLLDIDDFKSLFDLDDLPDEARLGYQTVGGLVVSLMRAIPTAGQWMDWGNLRIEVLDMDGLRVDKILITPKNL